jgi:hypothetical protein
MMEANASAPLPKRQRSEIADGGESAGEAAGEAAAGAEGPHTTAEDMEDMAPANEEDGVELDLEFEEDTFRINGPTGLDFTSRSTMDLLTPAAAARVRREALAIDAADRPTGGGGGGGDGGDGCDGDDDGEGGSGAGCDDGGDAGGSAHGLDSSFWIPATTDLAALRGVEQLVMDIFRLHTRHAVFDPLRSGAEWWVQVRRPDAVTGGITQGEEEGAGGEGAGEEEGEGGQSKVAKSTEATEAKEAKEAKEATVTKDAKGAREAREARAATEAMEEGLDVELRGETIQMHWDKDEVLHGMYGIHATPQLSTVTYLGKHPT